jgi:hypothetical protein
LNPAAEAEAYESIAFQVTSVASKEKAGGTHVGTIELKSANAKGTSKITIVGDDTLANEYRLGEFFSMKLVKDQAAIEAQKDYYEHVQGK